MEDKPMSTYERLSARFPAEAHKKVNKGGGDQTYVPAVDIFNRVDEVLGMTNWQARVIREGLTATEAWVLAEVAAHIDGELVVRQQYGCEAITVGRDAKPVGDLFKKAATDAYKKCLTLMGVARYLYDADERREVEAEMREAKRNPRPTAPTREVAAAAELTGAEPTPISPERSENIKKVQEVMRLALAEGLEFAQHDPFTMTDRDLQGFGKELADQVRAARKAKAS